MAKVKGSKETFETNIFQITYLKKRARLLIAPPLHFFEALSKPSEIARQVYILANFPLALYPNKT